MINIPYTYLIGWSKLNLFYYGVKYGKNCDPDTFWIKYFSSSKKVKELRQTTGDPDIIQIRRIFSDPKDAIQWESKVLRRMNVLQQNKWLNANISGAQIQTQEINTKRSQTMKGNITRSIQFKQNVSKVHLGKIVSEETKKKLQYYSKERHSQFGTTASENKKIKIGAKNKGNNKTNYICPNCQKEGKGSIMFRHHFTRCKILSKNNCNKK